MYRINDKESGVREIQRYLHFISDRIDNTIPRVSIDGIYGKATKNAVIAFQKSKNIKESGVVDLETFLSLFESYEKAMFLKRIEDGVVSLELFPFSFGDFGNEVLFMNLMLAELGKIYKDIEKVTPKSYFTRETEKAVRDVRKIFRFEDSGEIDARFYERMKLELVTRGAEY